MRLCGIQNHQGEPSPFGGFVCFARREKRREKLKKVKRIGLIDYSYFFFTAKLLHVDNVNASLRLA